MTDLLQTISERDIAGLLGITVFQFRQRRQRMQRAGFPRPLPCLPGRWSRAQVEDWIKFAERALTARWSAAAEGGATPVEHRPDGSRANILDFNTARQRRALEAIYGGGDGVA